MFFNKSIVSFIAAIALATSVTAFATPARQAVPSCNAGSGSLACCGSSEPFGSLTLAQQNELISLDTNLNKNLNVGLNCAGAGSQGCTGNNQALCCDAIQNTGVAANCVNAS
ncbi:hypothetical protein EI94DRAFT_1788185 [Lactarius quietus]|nr:hypothetical protein EI94DRAFT_1788185 [Lactarius quietus]